MLSSKPCLASMPRAFMMFQTSGLNTGSVRLETLITGFCCACAGGASMSAAQANSAANPRRNTLAMTFPLGQGRSEEHTSESSHTVISYAVFCLKKKKKKNNNIIYKKNKKKKKKTQQK